MKKPPYHLERRSSSSSSQQQQQQQQQQRPVFVFPKVQTSRTLNQSINTCPLTMSNLTVDRADFSFGSATASASSNGSSQERINRHLQGGADNSNYSPSYADRGGPGNVAMNRHNRSNNNEYNNIMTSEISWPAESPDPLSATARCALGLRRSPPGSPPSSPKNKTLAGMQALQAAAAAAAGGSQSQQHQEQQQEQQHHQHMQIRVPTKMDDSGSSSQCSNSHRRASRNHSMNHSYTSSPGMTMQRRSSFSTPLFPLQATIVFVDLEGYSKSSDVHQRHLTCDFMNTVRNLLTFAYGEMPVRGNIDNYVILPTGDGAAVIVIQPPKRVIKKCNESHGVLDSCVECNGMMECSERSGESDGSKENKNLKQHELPQGITCDHCSSTSSLRTTEETALWIGSSLLLWASTRQIGLRVGLNSGELSIVEDPYGDPNVCGDAINMAARIMDTALPGQILASASTVVPNLSILAAEDMAARDMGDLVGAYKNSDNFATGYDISLEATRRGKQECVHCPRIKYEIASKVSEVVVKHGVTSNVQSITCALHPLPRQQDLPPEFQPEGAMPMVPFKMPGQSESRRSSSATGDDVPQPLHTLSRTKGNPLKQSFASLSSLQPNGSCNSLRGCMKKGADSSSGPRINSSWKLGESFTKTSPSRAMSMLSQLSNEPANNDFDISSSLKTLPTSNIHHQQHGFTDQAHQQQQQMPQHVGNHCTPATKWYMKIKPTEMQMSSTDNQVKPKVLPLELIRRHTRIAFLGIMHDNLSKGFIKILENDLSHRWAQVYILFPSDACLKNHLAKNYRDQPVEKLILNKQECRTNLLKLLSPVVTDLQFLQYDQLMHCGSYWDWKDPGGFIHISPLTWGANPKTCPAMNYYWNSKVPSPEYRVYREGLEYLLDTAKPFDDEIGSSVSDCLKNGTPSVL